MQPIAATEYQKPPLKDLRQADLRTAEPPVRVVYGDGQRWTVIEAGCPASANPEDRCLRFDSDATVRRVRRFPKNWRELTDAELYDVSLSI